MENDRFRSGERLQMMYFLSGPVGSGKSLMATQRAIEYASQGRRIAANYDINVGAISRRRDSDLARASCTILPARITGEHLKLLGKGGPSEEKAGLLILDEIGGFLNARTWNDTGREEILNWFRLSRQLKWDVCLIAQALGMVDKQLREIIELMGRIRRTDRIKLLGVKMPRMHVCNMRYGTSPSDVVIERWFSRGEDAFRCYETDGWADADLERGPYSRLSSNLTTWRYKPLTLTERVRHAYKPFSASSIPGRRTWAPLRPKNRVAELLAKLPPDQRLKHWHRFNALGAFAPA